MKSHLMIFVACLKIIKLMI